MALGRYRYEVFVEMLGWKLNAPGGIEMDQFDCREAVYLLALDPADVVLGCARLLPTTRPYLLSEVFPHLFSCGPLPRSEKVWELSRFASVDLHGTRSRGAERFWSPSTRALLQSAMACAASLGAERLISVSPMGVTRLLRRLGVVAHPAGPTVLLEGRPTLAWWTPADGRALDAAARAPAAAKETGTRGVAPSPLPLWQSQLGRERPIPPRRREDHALIDGSPA